MRVFLFVGAMALAVADCAPARIVAQDAWPEFRGPTGEGHAAAENLPVRWSQTENVQWRQSLPGNGWSSPSIVDDRIFLTTAVPIADTDPTDYSLRALCLSADSGKVLWDREVFRQLGAEAPSIHSKNSHASPTPLINGGQVFVHFGHQGTACLDLDGQTVWKTRELRYEPRHGNGGSPILVDDKLIFSCDGSEQPFIVALDRNSGEVIWRTNRNTDAAKKFSFSTPLHITVDNQAMVISPGSNCVCAFDPADGREIWRANYDGYSVIPRPVYGHGLVFVSTSYDAAKVLAIRVDGEGDVTDTHVVWTLRRGAPHTPSMLLIGDALYMVSDRGVASCVDAKTGNLHWQERLSGSYSASPVHAGDKIYFQNESGEGTVIRAAKTFEMLAKNDLAERTLASYAVADGAIYIRTDKHLYRIAADSL